MSFLQPILLFGLPLALLPIIIHLINQHRHRTVSWAAMMFLLDAKKMTKGLARLRQILILAMRVLAILTLVFAASRPLAGGLAGFAGGKADTILVLLDRSVSMELQNLETGESKRSTALDRLAELIGKTGAGIEIFLIDSATLTPIKITDAKSLEDLPQTLPTATTSDIPVLLQTAVDFLATNESGRTDIWLASDLRQTDWNPGSGQWKTLAQNFAARDAVRLFLLTFPSSDTDNSSIEVTQVKRQRGPDGLQLVMDLTIHRSESDSTESEQIIPIEFTINGTRTVEKIAVTGPSFVRLGHTLPLGSGNERGWGRVDLPADNNPSDNQAFFVFDEAITRKTCIVSDDVLTIEALRTAASASPDPATLHEAAVFATSESAQIPWEETALLIWQAPLPHEDSSLSTLLQQHVLAGRGLILLPPPGDGGGHLFGMKWGDWNNYETGHPGIKWWRTESGLLANTRNGSPLSVSDLVLFRTRQFSGETQSLLTLENETPAIARVIPDLGSNGNGNSASFHVWGTLPRSDHSNLASEGIVFFVMLHRALDEGANAVSTARSFASERGALSGAPEAKPLSLARPGDELLEAGLAAGAYESINGEWKSRLIALNRPSGETDPRLLNPEALDTLLAGVQYRQIKDEVGSDASLAAEVWRAFLIGMALALIAEAALCLPPRTGAEFHPRTSIT